MGFILSIVAIVFLGCFISWSWSKRFAMIFAIVAALIYWGGARETEGAAKFITCIGVLSLVFVLINIEHFSSSRLEKSAIYSKLFEWGGVYLVASTIVKFFVYAFMATSWEEDSVITFVLPYKFVFYIVFFYAYWRLKNGKLGLSVRRIFYRRNRGD